MPHFSIKIIFFIIFAASRRLEIYRSDTVFHAASNECISGQGEAAKIMEEIIFIERSHLLPADSIIFTMIAGTSPECPVFPVEVDRIDRARGPVVKTKFISHLL